jgi:DNA-binding NtrC family response regulator
LTGENQTDLVRTLAGVADAQDAHAPPIDVRLIGTSAEGVEEMARENRLSTVLANVFGPVRLRIPPLRQRRTDIPLLAAHWIRRLSQARGADFGDRSLGAAKALMSYSWPGNVRELRELIHKAAEASPPETIDEKCIPSILPRNTRSEWEQILEALERNSVLILIARRATSVCRGTTLWRKMSSRRPATAFR